MITFLKGFPGRAITGFAPYNEEWVRLQNKFKCCWGNPRSNLRKVVKVFTITRTPHYKWGIRLRDKVEKEFKCYGFVRDFLFREDGPTMIKVQKLVTSSRHPKTAVRSNIAVYRTEESIEIIDNPFRKILDVI